MRIHRNLIKEGRELDGDLLRQRRNVYAPEFVTFA
jgi:hypothetical protein